jgi:hypothetical protein
MYWWLFRPTSPPFARMQGRSKSASTPYGCGAFSTSLDDVISIHTHACMAGRKVPLHLMNWWLFRPGLMTPPPRMHGWSKSAATSYVLVAFSTRIDDVISAHARPVEKCCYTLCIDGFFDRCHLHSHARSKSADTPDELGRRGEKGG